MVAPNETSLSAKAIVREYYEAHAQACDSEDFFGQVKRTVGGKPVSPEQIDMIVAAVIQGLGLESGDRLLDLCCGNGVLTTRFFAACGGGLGVDFSATLIDIANRHFVRRPGEAFHLQDVIAYLEGADSAEKFTKVVCYGGFQCLPEPDAEDFLSLLRRRFGSVNKVFLGNLPDKDRIDVFFGARERPPGIETSPVSPLGIWRTVPEMEVLCRRAGWSLEIRRMPVGFYAAHYRYDAVLTV